MDNVVHFEIPVDDVERAQKFYNEMFGWDINKAGDMPYWICTTAPTGEDRMIKEPGAINGAMLKRDEEHDAGSSHQAITIKVPDVGAYLDKIEAAGGAVVKGKTEVLRMGWYARVKDSEGNVIGLWQDRKA